VDLHSREMIESFMITLDAEKPQIDQALKIDCIQGQQNFYKMKFRNPFDNEQALFGISTSEAQLIQPKTATIHF